MENSTILITLSPIIALIVQILKEFGVNVKYSKIITLILSLILAIVFSYNKNIFDLLAQWISVAAAAIGSYELIIKPINKKTNK